MESRKIWLSGCVLATLIAFGGWVSTHHMTPTQTSIPRQLTIDDRGSDVAMRVGEHVTVKLPAKSATGYRWILVEKPGCIEIMADEFSDSSAQHFQILTFRSNDRCEGKLLLRYARSWRQEMADGSNDYWVRIITSG
jgi:predicted secreted protein